VVGIISDSAFSDLRAQFSRQLHSIFHLPGFPLIDLGNLWCKLRLGFDYTEGSPITHSAQIKVPVLLIHGDIDRFVPTEMSDALAQTLTCPHKLVHYPDAAHALNYARHPQAYQNELEQFLKSLPL
jgi:dipeptidyl aminopeptidase/acylaminoacyl peptidase